MYCSSCGAEAASGLKFCSRCGADLQSRAVCEPSKAGANATGYLAIALGFSVLGGIVALVSGVVKLAEMGIKPQAVVLFGLICAGLIFGVAYLLVNLMMKLNGIAASDSVDAETRATRSQRKVRRPTTQRSLGEHHEAVPPFASVTDRTTRIFEPARDKSEI